MELVEPIVWREKVLGCIIRAQLQPDKTLFLTPPDFGLQIGYVVTPAGESVRRHVHVPQERRVVGTPEVLVVKEGRCRVDIYGEEREFVASRELQAGDVFLSLCGGHGFHMMERTVFLEIKQGPYTGPDSREIF